MGWVLTGVEGSGKGWGHGGEEADLACWVKMGRWGEQRVGWDGRAARGLLA